MKNLSSREVPHFPYGVVHPGASDRPPIALSTSFAKAGIDTHRRKDKRRKGGMSITNTDIRER